MKILFIANQIPYPLDSGTRIRTMSFLKYFAAAGKVTLVGPGDPGARYESLQNFCEAIHVIDKNRFGAHSKTGKPVSMKERAQDILKRIPWNLRDFISGEFRRMLLSLPLQDYDLIFIRYPQLAYYFFRDVRFRSYLNKVTVDVDDISICMQERRIRRMPRGRERLRHSLDLYFLKNYYRNLKRVKACFIASEKDREYLLRERLSGNVFVVPNVFDVNGQSGEAGGSETGKTGKRMLFCGSLSFAHNEEGLLYFAGEIFPLIRKVVPEAVLDVIGKNPTKRVEALKEIPGINVIGPVAETKPYYERCVFSVVPLLNGAGTRIKILESLACGRTVVSTSIGAEGLDLRDGADLYVADGAETFAARCIELLKDPAKCRNMAQAGRESVKSRYSAGAFDRALDKFLMCLSGFPLSASNAVRPASSGKSIPRVSVIITTYNRAAYVTRAIESVLVQTFQDWELIVVDDGSVDNTREVVEKFCAQDKRIRYMHQNNQGVSIARNRGIQNAAGSYLAFLDDDDIWLPEKLEKHVNYMDQHPEAGLTYAKKRILRSPGRSDGIFPPKAGTTLEELLNFCSILTSMAVVRRRCLAGMRWFDPRYAICQDWELWLRLVQRTKFSFLDEILTVTQKDERKQLSKNMVMSSYEGMAAIRNLELAGDYKKMGHLKKKHIARIHYKLARELVCEGDYFHAAGEFAMALTAYPFVSLFLNSRMKTASG